MEKTSIEFLCDACSGKLLGDKAITVSGVRIDSREAGEGDLFVCVVGEINDGHKFAESAYGGGCRAFLMSDETTAVQMVETHKDSAVVLTKDTVKAFEEMADAYLRRFNVKKVAVTGSVGKTTTKMLTAAVMSSGYRTICTQKNLNTNLGLSMTAFGIQ